MVKNEIGRWKCHAFEFLPCIGFKKIYYIVLLAYLGEGGEAKWVGVRVVFHSRAYIFTSVSCSKMGKHNKEKRKNFEKKKGKNPNNQKNGKTKIGVIYKRMTCPVRLRLV